MLALPYNDAKLAILDRAGPIEDFLSVVRRRARSSAEWQQSAFSSPRCPLLCCPPTARPRQRGPPRG